MWTYVEARDVFASGSFDLVCTVLKGFFDATAPIVNVNGHLDIGDSLAVREYAGGDHFRVSPKGWRSDGGGGAGGEDSDQGEGELHSV